jgi:hypothetical protein
MFLVLFVLAAFLNILLGWHYWPEVLAGSLNDPDSYMRLLRIEQGVRAGHLVVNVARDQSGAGVYVEWSRLLDALLWLMAAPLAPFLGWHRALYAAGVALGPLGVGFLGLVLAWAAEPFAARRYLWTAAVAAAVLPGFTSLAMPGVVHYHVLLLAMIALTAGCVARAWRDDRWYGFLAGLAGGFAIWLTPETMPFVLAAFAVLLLRWWQVNNALVLLATAAGCFDVLGLGFFVDPPGAGYGDPAVDRISYVYLAMAMLLLGGTALLLRLQARNWGWVQRGRGPLGIALLGGLCAVWIATFPRVAMGPYGILPPDQARAFFGVISEQQPVRGAALVVFLFPGLCAVLYALWRGLAAEPVDFNAMAAPTMFGKPQRQRVLWLYIAFCGVVCLVLGARFLLFVGFSTLLAAAMLPVAISEMSSKWADMPGRAGFARIAALALVLVVPLLTAMGAPAPAAQAGVRGVGFPSCDLRAIAPLLAPAAGKVVLAGPEDAPELLYRTQVETVGSLYHHGVAGYLRDRAAWRVVPGAALPPELSATGAQYVLFCPKPGRYVLVQDLPTDTLWDALEAATPPPWLTLAGTNADGWRLYKVTP